MGTRCSVLPESARREGMERSSEKGISNEARRVRELVNETVESMMSLDGVKREAV